MYYMTETTERDHVMTVRLTRDERNMVKALAGADGVSFSDAIRMSIRQRYAERFGEKSRSKKGGR
jgi:hypothetical protein